MPNRTPVCHVQKSIQSYCQMHGFAAREGLLYIPLDEDVSTAIANLYEALPLWDACREVEQAYVVLAYEIVAQWDHAISDGYMFEAWTRPGQPYANSNEMVEDVRANHHLFFFQGGEPHPYLDAIGPDCYTYNEMLRAIHDLYGHSAEAYSFGPRGEENAWLKHSQMFSAPAQRALTTETRGQNSWVNFGPYRYLPAVKRPFAVQKVALLPQEYCEWKHLLS